MRWVDTCRLEVDVKKGANGRGSVIGNIVPLFQLSTSTSGFEAVLMASSSSGRLSTVRVIFDPFQSSPFSHQKRPRLKVLAVDSSELHSNCLCSNDRFSIDSSTRTIVLPTQLTANKAVTSLLSGIKESVRRRAKSKSRVVPTKRQMIVDGRKDRRCSRWDR